MSDPKPCATIGDLWWLAFWTCLAIVTVQLVVADVSERVNALWEAHPELHEEEGR